MGQNWKPGKVFSARH